MGKLEDLRVSLLDMSPEEVREKIRHIREDRKIVKSAAKMPATKRKAAKDKVQASVESLTPAQRAKLVAELKASLGAK